MRINIFAIFLLSASIAPICHAEESIPLDSCRSMALRNNKTMQMAAEKIKAAEYTKKEAFAAYLPGFDFSGLYLYNQKEISLLSGDQMLPTQSFDPATGSYQYNLVMKPDGTPCEDGEKGEIVIRTDKGKPIGLFKEYYRDGELTNRVWHDGVYHTGDEAWRDEDGYYWFVGRIDDVIKSSGYRIGPFEVESALMTHPAVLECAITGVPDEIRGMVVKATVVLSKAWRDRAGDELVKELQNHVKHETAPYKYPRVIEFVDELPKTISGKIRRVEIREKDRKR